MVFKVKFESCSRLNLFNRVTNDAAIGTTSIGLPTYSCVFRRLPEPNRACLVGVYAFLIWNNLCDLVYQTPTKSYQSQKPRFSTPTRT